MSDVMSEPVRQPRDGYTDYAGTGYPQAHVQEPGPTPTVYQGSQDYGRPAPAQAHPGESYR